MLLVLFVDPFGKSNLPDQPSFVHLLQSVCYKSESDEEDSDRGILPSAEGILSIA